MSRHEECISDGCEKLLILAEQLAENVNAKIEGVVMGLHVYNVLHMINTGNAKTMVQPGDLRSAGTLYWSGYPCTIDHERANSMPVFKFEGKEK